MFSASAQAFVAGELNFISNISLNLVIFEREKLSHITLEFEPCNISSFCGTIVEMASYETRILLALF